MQKLRELIELFLFFLFTAVLYSLFLLNLPLFQGPHGFLITNELSDFSNTQLIPTTLFGSAVVCALLGVLMMKWLPPFTAGMAANLWATTFFLMWVDSIFALSIQFQTFHYLELLGLGLLFLYLFFFTLHYQDFPPTEPEKEGWPFKYQLVSYWLGGLMGFYFIVSINLIINSYGYPEFQWPLALGFCALCFLNYLLFLFLRKSKNKAIGGISGMGRIFFGLWLLAILCAGIGRQWFH